MASNSSVSDAARAANMSQESDVPDRPRGPKDIKWNYVRLVKPNNYREMQYRKCNKILYGRINRFKQHITDVGREVAKCFSIIDEKRCFRRENPNAMKMKKVENKRADFEAQQEDQISEEREAEDPKLSLVGSKKPRVTGPLDRMVDGGKLK